MPDAGGEGATVVGVGVTGWGGGRTVVGVGATDGVGAGAVAGVGVTGGGRGGGGTVVGVGVTNGAGDGTVVGVGEVTGVGGGFVTAVGLVVLFAWPTGGRLTVTARDPEDCAKARPIPAAATTAITARTIPSRLLMVGSFDSVFRSENPPRLVPTGIPHFFIRSGGSEGSRRAATGATHSQPN